MNTKLIEHGKQYQDYLVISFVTTFVNTLWFTFGNMSLPNQDAMGVRHMCAGCVEPAYLSEDEKYKLVCSAVRTSNQRMDSPNAYKAYRVENITAQVTSGLLFWIKIISSYVHSGKQNLYITVVTLFLVRKQIKTLIAMNNLNAMHRRHGK